MDSPHWTSRWSMRLVNYRYELTISRFTIVTVMQQEKSAQSASYVAECAILSPCIMYLYAFDLAFSMSVIHITTLFLFRLLCRHVSYYIMSAHKIIPYYKYIKQRELVVFDHFIILLCLYITRHMGDIDRGGNLHMCGDCKFKITSSLECDFHIMIW